MHFLLMLELKCSKIDKKTRIHHRALFKVIVNNKTIYDFFRHVLDDQIHVFINQMHGKKILHTASFLKSVRSADCVQRYIYKICREPAVYKFLYFFAYRSILLKIMII